MKNHYFQKEKTNSAKIEKLVEKAYNILNGEMPGSNDNCDYCKWKEYSLE